MDTSRLIEGLTKLTDYDGQIVHLEKIPPRAPRYADLGHYFHHTLENALNDLGMLPLYGHQGQAIEAVKAGSNVMVATPAASGKSLIYNSVVLDSMLRDQGTRALYIFPTKALTQGQWKALKELTQSDPELEKIKVATFDGDTPGKERGEIRRSARILLTNPDMLHLGILPNHRSWIKFLRRLKYVVLDEAHVYRGVFGSHAANVLRRLRRLCRLHGSSPQFILSSATISNPGEHAEALVGKPFEVFTEDGSPSGGKDFVFWNPPIIDEDRSHRRSSNSEATLLFTSLVSSGIRTLAFARSRQVAELIYMYSRENLAVIQTDLARRVMPYRAGYLPEERRHIEQGLFNGDLLGVCATNALELGIDIGDLDATVLTGYPGSIASVWQQAGRSGRRGHRSLSFLIGMDNPLDQYFMRHPREFFDKPHEHALISPFNPHILTPHLICSAYEWPLSSLDEGLFGDALLERLDELEERGTLRLHRDRWYLSTEFVYPAQEVNIRSTSSNTYAIVLEGSGVVLETIEESTAFFQIHQGAVYLHKGDSYLVTDLDLNARVAHAVPRDINYYTQTIDVTDIRIIEAKRQRRIGSVQCYLGKVEVSNLVVGYKRKARFTEEIISEESLDLPPRVFETTALWFDIPERAVDRILKDYSDYPGGLHAVEHTAIGLLPMFALCDRNDIGGLSTPMHPDTGQAQIIIYDGYPGGIGITEKGYELMEELWKATLKTLQECPCESGCPSCVQSPKCGNNNEPLDKTAARILMEELLRGRDQRL